LLASTAELHPPLQQPNGPAVSKQLEGSVVMKLARFVCLFLFVATSLFGQSSPGSEPKQSPTSPSFSRLPLRPPLAPAGRLAASSRSNHPQSSGLNFAPAVTYSMGPYGASSVAVTDVNGDGKPDLLVATGDGVGVLLGKGDGTFQAALTYGSGGWGGARSVAVADVNRDGKPDLLVANACADNTCVDGSVGVLLGNGDGTFQTVSTYSSGGYYASSIAVADMNGDGKPDLVVTNYCDTISDCGNGASAGTVGVLLGNGDGTFQPAVTYNTGAYGADSVAVADLNGDGKLDVVVAGLCARYDYMQSECVSDGTLGVLLGNGDGTFQALASYDSGGIGASSVAIADLNGDGNPDLVVGNGCYLECYYDTGVVAVLLGNGDGTFQGAVGYNLTGVRPQSVAIADLDGDGKPDIVEADYYGTLGVLLGNGNGTFQTVVTFASGGSDASSVAVADVNADGKPDLLVNPSGTVGVLINISTFPTTTALVSSPNPSNYGQAVAFAATVTPQFEFGKSTPTGSVSFFDGATSLGNSPLNSAGVATLSISSLAVGTHSVTATYGGDSNFASSTSSALSQVVQGAIVQLSPTSLNFGNQTVSIASSSQNVTVSNTGNAALTITNIAVVVSNGGYLLSSTCAASLAPGASCTVSLSWTPVTTGSMTGSVAFTDNAQNSPQTVSLAGVGVQPTLNLSPTSLTFPTQIVFTRSKTQTVMLSNTGLGILSITKIAATGSFTQTNNCGSTVNPGSNCTITATFRPTKAGSITGSLSITDNAPLSPQTVSLKGTGTYVQLTPASLKFGNQPVGTKSLPKKMTLSNKGSVAVSITKISLTGANAGDFAQTNTCGKSVAAGASCSITVTFTPSAKGKRAGTVSSFDNGGGSPQIASLTGTGT
jgi:hypothetical protein